MINNWEIISRIDPKSHSVYHTLLMDGTVADARIIAKKLKGYVGDPSVAEAPYVFAFQLLLDMDEATKEKVHIAIEEGIKLSKKVGQFVPGGSLGDPLFNNTIQRDFPTFLQVQHTIAPKEVDLGAATRFFQVENDGITPVQPTTQKSSGAQTPVPPETTPKTPASQAAQPGPTPQVSQPQPPEVPVLQQPQSPAVSPADNRPVAAATDHPSLVPETNLEKDLNDIEIQAQTIAVPNPSTDLNPSTISISDNDMLIKDMEGSMLEKMPLEDILSAETKYDVFVDVVKTPQQAQKTQQTKEQKMAQAQPENSETFNVFEHELKDQTNVIDVEEVQTITDQLTQKNVNFMNNSQPEEQNKPAAPNQQPEAASIPTVSAQEGKTGTVPFTLGAAPQGPKHMLEGLSSETIPEEEALTDTLPPQTAQEDVSLPEITVRAQKKDLEKTFNLETTFNTEFLKKQDVKNKLRQEGKPTQAEPPHAKTILRLKRAIPNVPQTPGQLGKTVLRLRRKGQPPAATPNGQAAQPLKSTRILDANNLKQKNIDHSIQIPTSELKKHNWPLEVPLVPIYTLSNMVMSVNRFAHATAISVIENPGKLYNPLVLHGGTGTGKTHFLNALAYAFSQKFGQEHIFMTNGVRLSRGIQRYVMEGNIDKFENFMQSVRVLLIDDIHLLAINEQNRAYVSKLLNTFLQEQKQIVITSKYPPESLEKLEELIKFKLDAGWISELKPATGATHFRIVKKMLFENGVDLNDKQIEEFFGAPHMTLGTVTRSIRRLKVLENLIFPNIPAEQKSQAGIFEKLLATKGEDQTSELINKDPAEITTLNMTGNGEWGRIGFFYPQNSSDMMNWMVYALEQRAKELGIDGGFEIVVRSSYSTENIISSAFKIANLCDNKKLKGAVILGPMPQSCDPSVRENFYDILTHMLEIMLIRCGIINFENVRLPSTYVKVISELMR